jgi:hypothetical protein
MEGLTKDLSAAAAAAAAAVTGDYRNSVVILTAAPPLFLKFLISRRGPSELQSPAKWVFSGMHYTTYQ